MADLPLTSTWERAAAKELSQILYGICSGGFDQPGDLAARLKDVENWLNEIYGGESSAPAASVEAIAWLDEQFLGGL